MPQAGTKTKVVISEAQKDQLREDGYFITPPLFDAATLASVKAEFQRLWDEDIPKIRSRGTNAKRIEYNVTTPFIHYAHERSRICAEFCRHPALVNLAGALLGPETDLFWNQAILKAPGKGKSFAWHQDAYYAAHGAFKDDAAAAITPGNLFTFWIAITRTTVENGTVWLVPGLHRQGLLPHDVMSEERAGYECRLDTSMRVPAVLQPGQVLVFSYLTPHGSSPNTSDEVRMAYQLVFGKVGIIKNEKNIPVLRGGKEVG